MATEEDRINTGVLLTIGAVLAIATVGVALAITAMVRAESDQLVAEKGSTANLRPIQELRQQQQQVLETQLGWADKAAAQVSVPIERAEQLVLDDIRRDPSKATAPAPPPDGGAKAAADAGASAGDAAGAEDAAAATDAAAAPESGAGEQAATADAGAAKKPKPGEQPEAPEAPPAPSP